MINLFNNQINNLTQLITLVILPFSFLILITKINIILTFNYQKKYSKNHLIENKKISFEKITIIFFQFLILILMQKFNNLFPIELAPFLSLVLFLQFIICFIFLIKINDQKLGNNIANFMFIILISFICLQFLLISWKIHDLIFQNFLNFLLINMIYSIVFLIIYKFFNQNFLIIKYLIIKTHKIIFTKKNNLYKNKEKLTSYFKTKFILNLWSFENIKQEKNNQEKQEQVRILKADLIIFIIACYNLFYKNIIKTQKIIINGWKSSLVE